MSQTDEWPTTREMLLAKIQDPGDAAAWQAFVDLYAPLVYGHCRNRGLQHADAQDVAQEVFYRVSRAIGDFRYDTARGRFRNWLGLVTHQQVLRHRQKQARRAQGMGAAGENGQLADSFEGAVEGAWIEAFNAHIYACALVRIRPEFDEESWHAFERVWGGQERPSEVAQALQKQVAWIYQVKHKIVGRLKEEIQRLSADVALFNRP